jgi:hypothetical protein
MAVARVDNPWVRNLTLAPSRVYATSPYRPYAGVFNNRVNVSTEQYQDNFIRALSPFSINDKNVINAIRKEYNIVDNGNYRMSSNVGFGVGAVAGVVASGVLYGSTITTLANAAIYGGMLSFNPVGWTAAAVGTVLAVAGTIMTSAELGRAIGASVGSREGSIAMSRYLANLGNSMVKRPTSTVLTVATIFATNWALNKTPLKSPIVRQGITMTAMRVVRPIADKLDDSLFGELSEVDQMSYTDLLSLQGDLADNFSGTSLVKGALAGVSGDEGKTKELIAKMYGRHEEGFDPLDFMDVREAWGIDIGTFGNGVIDILGEIVFDTDNSLNTIKNKTTTTISTSIKNQVVKKILSNENGDLFKRYFEKVETKNPDGTIKTEIKAKDTFKNEFQNKIIQRVVEKYLDDYKDPSTAKTAEERNAIFKENNEKLDHHIGDLYIYLYRKGLANIKEDSLKIVEAQKIIGEIKKEIQEGLEAHSGYMEKNVSNKTKYAKAVKTMIESQKEATKIVNQNFKNNVYNFDKAMLKEFQIHKADFDHNYITGLLKLHPAFYLYSEANNKNMRVLGYFTRPFQSAIASKPGRKVIQNVLNKIQRKYDPYKKITKVDEIMQYDNPITKEQQKEALEKLKQFDDVLKAQLNKFEEEKMRQTLGQAEIDKLLKELNDIEEFFATNKLTDAEKIKYEKFEARQKELTKKYAEAKAEAIKKMEVEDKKAYARYKKSLKTINDRYKQLIANAELVDKYMEMTKFEYVNKGVRQKMEVNKDTEQEVLDIIKELEAKKDLSGDERITLENAKFAYFLYMKEDLFKKGYQEITSNYNKVIKFIQNFETWFTENAFKLESLVLNTTIFSEVKQLQKEIRDIDAKPSKTQDELVLAEKERIKSRYEGLIKTVYANLENAEVFDKKTRDEIIKALEGDEMIELPIFYATNFFSGIKLFEQDKSFFLNNRALFDEFNKRILEDETQDLLDRLKDSIIRKSKTKFEFKQKTEFINNKELLIKKIQKILLDLNTKEDPDNPGSKLLSDENYELLKQNIEGVATSLINTNRSMQVDPTTLRKNNMYSKRFSELSQNDILDYAFRLATKNNEFLGTESKMIDNVLKNLDHSIKQLLQVVKESNNGKLNFLEGFINESIRRQMYKINSSKIINAISAKYLRVGQSKNYFLNPEVEGKKIKALSEKALKKISNKKYKFETTDKDVIKQGIAAEFLESFKGTPMYDLLIKMGFEKIINDNVSVIDKEEVKPKKVKKRGKSQEEKDFEERGLTYTRLVDGIVKDIEIKTGKVLDNEARKKISQAVAKAINDQIGLVKSEYEIKRMESAGSKKVFDDVFMNKLAESFFGKLVDVENLSSILRGNKSLPKTKIDMTKPDPESGVKGNPYRNAIINFMLNNEPTVENIMKLKLQPFGTYLNFDGKAVSLESIVQIGEENLVGAWAEKYRSDFSEKNEYGEPINDPLVFEFFRGIDVTKESNEGYERHVDASFNLPNSLRNKKGLQNLKDEDFVEVKDDFESDGTIANDFIRVFKESDYGHNFKKIAIHKGQFVFDDVIRGKTVTNDIIVIRITTTGNKSYDFYVPREIIKTYGDQKIATYKVNNNEYMRVMIEGEDEKSLAYLDNISKAIEKDFINRKMISDEFKQKFEPFSVQKEIFRLFSKQRNIGDTHELITDFVYLDPDKTDYEKLVYSLMRRLDEGKRKNLTKNKAFRDDYKKNGYYFDYTQSDPKVVVKGIKLNSGEFQSITRIFSPLGIFTGRAERSALAANARRNAIELDTNELPFLSSLFIQQNPELSQFEKGGFNARVYLKDTYLDNGSSTHNETVIMREGFARQKFIKNGVPMDLSNGMKIIDRYSSKHGVRIVSEDEWKEMFKGDDKALNSDVIMSKRTVRKRTLWNVEAELAMNGLDGTRKYIDSEMKGKTDEEKLEYLKSETKDGNLEGDHGYLYMFLTDDLSDNNGRGYKVAGDNDSSNGAKISIEEWQMFSALREITYAENGSRQPIDPNGELFDFLWKRTKTPESELRESIYGNVNATTGKQGKFRKEIIERRMPNSAYAKAISNTKLAKNEIGIPRAMAESMGIIVKIEDGSYSNTTSSSQYVLLHRSPTQGRRSFVYAKVKILDDVKGMVNKAIEVNPAFEEALNLDFDGDGVSIFSLKDATPDILKIAETAFSHSYKEKTNYSDYTLRNEYGIKHKDVDMKTEKDFDINRDKKDILNEEAKPKGYKPSFVSEDQWDNVMLNQKTLKDYSGLFKNIFDADYQDYISSKENMDWFNKTFKTEDISNVKFESFYALTTLAYDFYSQKTFDFSKHSRPGEKESFDAIYSIIKKKGGETFENHIRKLVKVLMFDITNTQKKNSKIELINKRKDISDSEKSRLSDIEVQKYLYKLREFLKEVSREEQRLGKTKPEIIKEAETKEIEGEKVKPEEELPKQFEEADNQLLRDINKILKDNGLEETTMDQLGAFKSDKLLSITGAFDQNEIKHFNLNDWNLDLKGVNQVFSFMLKMNQDIAKAAKRKMKTNDKVLEPFHKAFTTYIRQVIQSFYQDPDVLKNLYLIKIVEINGEEVPEKISFLELINVFGLKPDGKSKRSIATFKNINPAITKMDSIGVNKDVLRLDDKRLRSFYISNESAFESPKLNRLTNELFTKVHNNIRKTLNNMGLGGTPVFSPLLHNKLLFKQNVFDSMYQALMSNEEDKSILVDILRDMGDEDSINELKEIFKPFFMFQTVAQFLSGDKRTNFIKYLYQVEGIFDDTIKTVIPEKKTGALVKNLIRWNLMKTGEPYEDFGNEIKVLLNTNDDKVVDEIVEIYYQMRNGLLDKDTYGSMSQFDKMDREFKLDLLVKIHEIKNGKFVEKFGSKYGITQEDLREKTENFEIDDKVMAKFFRIYDYAFDTIEGTFDIKNRQRITSALEKEKINFGLVSNVIKNANYELSKLVANTITIQNSKGEAEDVNPYPFRSLLHPNNIEENSIILMNANKNKMAKNLTERFYRLVMKAFNKEGADSEMTKEIQKISNDLKAGNDIMSLYLFEGKDIGSFIKLLNDLINNQQTFTIPLTDRIFKYFLHFNEMSKVMGFDKKIMPGTIDAYYRDIKGSNVVDSEGNIKMNNIYRIMFFDYVYGEGMQINARNNTPEFQEAFNNLVSYFDKNPNMNTFGLHPHAFVETFFGKMLFEQRVESEKHTIKEDPKPIQEKLIEYYKDRIKELEVLSKNRDSTSNEYLKAMEEATEKGETLDLSQITIDPVKQQEILDAYKKYLSVELLEEKIVDDKVSNVFDTFEWSKYIGQEGVEFNTKNLFNIYAQLIGKKEFPQEEIVKLTEELSQEIIRDNTNANFKFKGNKKIHTALIDAQLNLKVMDLIVREFEKNEGRYKDYQELKTLINDFKDPSKKKNFAIIDSENLVSGNDYNRIYEISYITFDDNGKPLYHQHYLKYDIDKRTENWLKKMGYSDKEIQIIKDNMKNIADPDYNKKIYEQVFADLKGKNLIGQSVKSQGDTPGDIGKLNYEYQQILKNDVRKTIKKHNEKEQEFLDNIKESSMKDLMKNVDSTELNSTAQADMMMKVLIDIVKEDLNEKILPQGVEKIDNEQFNTHISKTSELMRVFIEENNQDILKLRMEEILEIDEMPKEVFDAILKKFEDKFNELKGENNDGVLVMKWPRIVKTEDGVRVEFLEVDEKEIVGKNEEFLVKKVRFDSDDVRANYLFRSRAFYEIIKEVKDMIIIRGIPHEHLGKTVQRTITLNQYEMLNRKIVRLQGKLDDKNLKVKKHLDDATKFMMEGNEVEYLVSMNKAIKEYEKTNSKMDAFTDIDLETDSNKVDLFLKEQVEKNTGQMANIPMWRVEQHFADMISKFYKDTLASKRTIEEKEQDYKYIAKIEDIITALEYEDMNTLDFKRFADIVGLNEYGDFGREIHTQLMETYEDYKKNGIPFFYAGSDKPYSTLEYKEDGENLFKKMAFYAILNPRSDDKKTLGSFLKMIISEEGVREYKRYDIDETKQTEIDKVKSKLVNKKQEDARNKEAFADARIEVKNMILKEDWAGLEAYLKDKPGEKFNIEEFKQRFYEEFNKTKTKGIAKYKMEWRMEGQTPTPFEKFIESVPYIEQPGVRGEFLRTVISNFEKEISGITYIKSHYTTLDPTMRVDKPVTYKYYNDHLEDYNGKWVPSDYRRDHPQNQTIRKSYDYLRANVDKTRDLSQYQAGFEGMIAPFRKGNSYDYEKLYYELTEGYLSKIYKLTIITDISKGSTGMGKLTEEQEIEASTERRNKAFQKGLQKKIDKLENKIIELQKLNTPEANQQISQIRLQIDDTKKVVYQKNKYYDEAEISKLRRSEPIWKSDQEVFGSSIIRTTDKKGNVVEENMLDWMDSIKDTAHPTLKVIALDGNKENAIKQLKELVKMNREKGLHLGFTLLHDILKTDEMSYSGYMLPKPVAMLQSSIIKFQKFMMLMNNGFMVRNIYDGMLRNHQLILGSDDIVSENFRFAKEAVRSWNLIFQYKAYAKAHGFQVRELKHFFESVKDFESGPYALHDLQKVSTDFQAMLTLQIDSLKNYLGNIIKDENQTATRRASDNFTDLSRIMRRLQAIVDTLKNNPATKSPEYIKEFKLQLKDFFEVYQQAGFFKQVIMNANDKRIKLDFSNNSEDNIKKTKDNLNMVRLINEIEKSGIISDQYEITGKQDVKDIYRNIDKMLDDELMNVGLNDRIDKIMSHHPIAIATNYVEQHQRVHGVLLDMFVNGKTKDRALAESLGRFFNYGMKGAYEKSASVYFPFMSFAIRNLDYYLDLMGDQKYMRFMTNVAQGMNTWYDDEDEENFRFSRSFNDFTENQGWIPLGKNYGIKMGNAMFDAMSLVEDPFQSGYQKLNPVLQQANNLTKGEDFNPKALASVTQYSRMASAIGTIAKGQGMNMPQDLPDLVPSLFYKRSEYTPYKYRRYSTDYRNIYRNLFFSDGSRRVPSKNPFTTAKNIRYEAYVRARLNANIK